MRKKLIMQQVQKQINSEDWGVPDNSGLKKMLSDSFYIKVPAHPNTLTLEWVDDENSQDFLVYDANLNKDIGYVRFDANASNKVIDTSICEEA